MIPVLFSFGSNIEPRVAYIQRAIWEIAKLSIENLQVSPVYETEPVEVTETQQHYLNLVVYGETTIPLVEWHSVIKGIERKVGRTSFRTHAPREIDIDLLLYGFHQYSSADFIVPHPRLHLRMFVLKPAADIVPDLLHPVFGVSIRKLLTECPYPAMVRRCPTSLTV